MKKKKKAKDATGSPHNLANAKRRDKVKVIDNRTASKADSPPISSRTPNNFHRSGNDADRELEVMRQMDSKKQMLQRRKK